MYLDHTFARKTFAQRIDSAKVKSKSEVAQCIDTVGYAIWRIVWRCSESIKNRNLPLYTRD